MHDDFILVKGRIGCFINDVVDYRVIVSACIEQSKAIECSSIGVVINTITSVVLGKEFGEMFSFMGIFEDKTKRSYGRKFIPMS